MLVQIRLELARERDVAPASLGLQINAARWIRPGSTAELRPHPDHTLAEVNVTHERPRISWILMPRRVVLPGGVPLAQLGIDPVPKVFPGGGIGPMMRVGNTPTNRVPRAIRTSLAVTDADVDSFD